MFRSHSSSAVDDAPFPEVRVVTPRFRLEGRTSRDPRRVPDSQLTPLLPSVPVPLGRVPLVAQSVCTTDVSPSIRDLLGPKPSLKYSRGPTFSGPSPRLGTRKTCTSVLPFTGRTPTCRNVSSVDQDHPRSRWGRPGTRSRLLFPGWYTVGPQTSIHECVRKQTPSSPVPRGHLRKDCHECHQWAPQHVRRVRHRSVPQCQRVP